jgi:hypothetical protein
MAAFGVKDAVILAHIYLYCAGITVLMFKHPETCAVGMPTIGTLLGFTHWFIVHDDKVPDAQ